ncbi:heparinase II/III family protein [Cohnella sp. 56]|uniref:heparinase II/III family protein n=1 Tax=Cohnella sp. 56 TaxID=3113722 RepID=UPI0030EAD717
MWSERWQALPEAGRRKLAEERFLPFPRYEDRAAWEAVPSQLRDKWVQEAERCQPVQWPTLTAGAYLQYRDSGDRKQFESLYFRRRGMLAALTAAECLEGRGRFLADIADGLWLIAEETSWCVPAHLSLADPEEAASGLPGTERPTVDLFASGTGAMLALTVALLETPLSRISVQVPRRIRQEVDRRILTPYLERDDFWWMGFGELVPNNWNPWCNANCLAAMLLLEGDAERRLRFVDKAVRSLDRYWAVQYEDGGCDEGASYWHVAAGCLYDALELLSLATGGALRTDDEPLLRRLGEYVVGMFIDGDYVVNAADGAAKSYPDASLLYRFGRGTGSEALMALGAYRLDRQHAAAAQDSATAMFLYRDLMALFTAGELERRAHSEAGRPPAELYLRETWLPQLQVLTAREREGTARGLHMAVKGGHNNESHNHNDIGQVSVSLDGFPCLIDVGVETYTARTFSLQRYEIWTMQSGYHNVPVINGLEQRAGAAFRASGATAAIDERRAGVRMELTTAYPEQAGIASWQREAVLYRGAPACIEVTDTYKLIEKLGANSWTFMTCWEPSQGEDGTIVLHQPGDDRRLVLAYDAAALEVRLEPIRVADEKLVKTWGTRLHRIRFEERSGGLEGSVRFRIARG